MHLSQCALNNDQAQAAVVWVLLFSAFSTAQSEFVPVDLVGTLIFFGLAAFCLIRFGLLTLVTNYLLYGVLQTFPLTMQRSAWYADISLAGILLIAAVTFYGFYTSLGGRPAFGGAVLEE